jgi:hypothetical protein
MSRQELHLILNRLPDAVLDHLVLYLPRSSRALLGAALAQTSNQVQCNWKNYDDWETLDFSDLGKDLAAKLTDDDLYNVLKWIDANQRLRILKLTNCVNITGRGLYCLILHGAINLRQIDLSLVGKNEAPTVVPEPALAQAVVLPILSHLVKSEHVDIRHIQMPKHWRIIENNSELKQFFALYSKSLAAKHSDCSQCSEPICKGGEGMDWMNANGLQKFTCYECMDSFCNQCNADVCGTCEKLLCLECSPVVTCCRCKETTCNDCKSMDICDDCNKVFCKDCGPVMTCFRCRGTKCAQCCRGVHHCVDCNTVLCDDCVPMCCCHSCSRTTCHQCGPLLYCKGCDELSACFDCSNQTQNVWWCDACECAYCPDCRVNEYRRDEFCFQCQGTL